jgi:hypothetical protein
VFKCSRKPPTGKRGAEPPAKKIKFNVMEQISSMTAKQYNEMEKTFQQVQAVRLLMNGESSVQAVIPEQILAVTATTPTSGSRPSCSWYHMLRQIQI